MVREILRDQEPIYHQHLHGQQHTHDFGGKVNIPVPAGYVREV